MTVHSPGGGPAEGPAGRPAGPPAAGGLIRWRRGRVTSVGRAWSGSQELQVAVDDGDPDVEDLRALAYPALVGLPEVGDRVLLNTTALARGLGTGGYALVVAIPDRLPADPLPAPGHLVKARYTPLQPMLLGVDEQESEHHEAMAAADSLDRTPVVVADLHSALPAVVAGVRADAPGVRVGYVMTDGGALPAWFSRAVAGLRDAGWLVGCVTVGQAFGGDLEAVTVHTGMLAARKVLAVDVLVVAQGPGNLGSGTRWGFSGVASGEAVNAVAALGGRAVASLRVSETDQRERHHGVSHHSLTAYGRVALAPADVVVPVLEGPLGDRVRAQAAALGTPAGRHRLVDVRVDGLLDALRASPVSLSTMGRGLDDDTAAFLSAAAAGRHAASLLG